MAIQHFMPCKWILIKEIGVSRVRLWDLMILIPNIVFSLFLIYGFKKARIKLRITRMPVISTFYYLIWLCNLLNILRCVVYMSVSAKNPVEDTIDKLLWLILRFFLLSTELSVLIFGLAFGKLESQKSIRWVMFFASMISLIFSFIQGFLELYMPDKRFNIDNKDYDVFAQGGSIFLFVTSAIFTCMYLGILMLPKTKIREKLSLPTKKTFYYYCAFLAILNLMQTLGSCMLIFDVPFSLCIIDTTSYIYLISFAPLVYRTFLKGVFKITYASLFAYRPQINQSSIRSGLSNDTITTNTNDDLTSLPNHSSFYNEKANMPSFSLCDNNNFSDPTQHTEKLGLQDQTEASYRLNFRNNLLNTLPSPMSPMVQKFLLDHTKPNLTPINEGNHDVTYSKESENDTIKDSV
ncbi:unnamed protein product [Gordionus sp. m RMFG-2023]|uniref:transmembrane protein adipocyte-associated 1 homolog n=1 Tax=Gordionus sp. m RMFG-2023 TaxID=3053472 RepID=UPI0030DE63D4